MKKIQHFPDLRSGVGKVLRIMKITTLILLVCITTISANTFSQNKKISLDVKNATIEEVFNEVEKISDYGFFFKSDQLDTEKRFNLKMKDASIEAILDKVLSNNNYNYTIVDNNIVISRESITAVKQGAKITGKVTDSDGEPLPGVSVVVKGTTVGITTDLDGNYTLDVPAGAEVLIYSFVGMRSQEVVIGGQSVINIQLEEDAIGLDEVVAVGYGVQKKVNMTGSITSVKTEELTNIPAGNLSNTMAGRAPGVQVVGNSGLSGASSSIRIRGSFGDPLFIIDGVEADKTAFDALDANEVESINFLKDAASSAIYGSKAGNGVVLVTTKTGEQRATRISFKSSFSTSRTTEGVQSYTATEELNYVNNMNITKGQPAPYGDDIFAYFADKSYDINDLIWQNPSVQQHNVSVDGGNEKMNYYISLGYHNEEGSYHNTGYDRYNFRSNVTAKITDRFKVNFNLSGNQRDYNRWYWPYDGAEDFTVSDWYRATFNWTRLYPFYTDEQGNPTNDPNDIPVKPAGGYHPVEVMLNGGYRDTRYRTFDGILKFDLDLSQYIDGLSTSVQGHVSANDGNMKSLVKHNKWYILQTPDTNNKFIPGPVDFTKTASHTLSSGYENIQENVSLSTSYQINWFLNYAKTFGKHDVSGLVVFEQQGSDGKNLSGKAEQLLSSDIDQIYNTSSDTERRYFSGSEYENARLSWIGRATYSYASKYMAEFSFRYDGNYKFAPKKRWGFFPSISAGWRMSEEAFMKDIDWLTNLKIRGSYGETGDDGDIGAWKWTNKYQKTTGYVFGSTLQDGLKPGSMPNPDITWATVSNWNIGFEYGLFNNKLTGEFDIWGKTKSDILGSRLGSTPTTLGASLPKVNYAEQAWNGIEVSASYKTNIGEVKFEAYGNLGYAIDEWKKIDEAEALHDGTYKDNWQSALGKPNNRLKGLISKGIIRTQEQLDAVPEGYTVYGREAKIGTILFEDIRGPNLSEGPDGKIDGNDVTYLSDNGAPRINFGFGFNFEWKGFSVNTHFQGVGAYDRMVATRNSTGGGVFQVDRPYFELWADNYWTPETPDAKYPRVAGNWMQAEYGGAASTFWMRNGAYVRLKNLNVGYTLPKRWYKSLGIGDIQLFANGTNLFVITGFDEHDPEQETLDSYPIMKTFTGGLSINF
ncbi:SusC/RagA family TonB-linked outer membrane protein [Puteibacter caeruleilacunae]|nr:SusC/RagA family TonB-linked outer membrane protein [Puteibacter caeruleilacunae]